MKMFIWRDPYHVHYGQSLFVVVSETLEEARAIASRDSRNNNNIQVGAPNDVYPVPCGEWFEWHE